MVVKLQNLIQVLKSRGFVNQVQFSHHDKTYHAYSYGAPGAFLRHNIKQQWWRAMVLLQSNVFPLETPSLQLGNFVSSRGGCDPSESDLSTILRHSLQNDCRNKYLDILTLANNRLPFSIASTGECFHNQSTASEVEDAEREFFTRHSFATEMLLQNYVVPSGISRIFDYWLQLRLSWWKKFSKNPSKFRVASSWSDGGNGSVNGAQSRSIVYDFPWGPETLEVVCSIGDEDLRRLHERKGENYMAKMQGTKSVLPYCVQCKTSLNLAMAAFLVDSFHQRKMLTKSKTTSKVAPNLQIHPHLAPFHVALVISANDTTTSKELGHISKQLEQDLLKADVSVFNASEHVGTLNAHFKRNDQLGIPYTFILNENTLKDGVINSRDRDTEIKKPVHVSRAAEEISRNIKAVLH